MQSVDVLIIGGGPTGLGAACRLEQATDVTWLLCESRSTVGGLSASIRDEEGYTWDIGGHVCFSHYEHFTRLLEEAIGRDGCIEHQREAWINVSGRWVPYPFQNNLHRLTPANRDRCLAGLAEASERVLSRVSRDPADFSEYLEFVFGKGITEIFMQPYNEKVWAHPLASLSYSWTGERIAIPDVDRAIHNARLEIDDVGWGPNSTFSYPRLGGTGAYWESLAARLPSDNVRLGCRVLHVDRTNRIAQLEGGEEVSYETLISTAPVDALARMTEEPALIGQAAELMHSSVNLVGLGVAPQVGEKLGTKCWVYFADRTVPFYRVTHLSHYSPLNTPRGAESPSLLIEVSESTHRPVEHQGLIDSVVDGLISTGLLDDAHQVSHVWTHREEYAYPTPTLRRDAVLDGLLDELDSTGILSRGRFGGWRYEVGNMDHSFMQGYEAAERLLLGTPELTLFDPQTVNNPGQRASR